MTRLKAIALVVGLAAGITGTARAGDCYNDDDAAIDDLEPAVLKISDADIDALLAAIRAHERRMLAARDARAASAERAIAGADSPS